MSNFVNPINCNPFFSIIGYNVSQASGAFLATGQDDAASMADPILIKKVAGAWAAAPLPLGVVGNLDWHGGGETVTWKGPCSRYWFDSSLTRTGTAVYRKGRVWAQAPFGGEKVLGCGVMESGGIKYLTIAVIDSGTLAFYQREFAETYSSNTYLDWTRIFAYVLPSGHNLPATPMFFSESGMLCSGIFGVAASSSSVTTEVKIQAVIGLGIAGITASGCIGSYSESTSTTDNSSYSISITHGAQDDPPCGAVAAVCTETDANGDCVRSQEQYKTSGTGNGGNSRSTSQGKAHIIAVDYEGESELLCSLDYDIDESYSSSTSSESEYNFDNELITNTSESSTSGGGGVTITSTLSSPKLTVTIESSTTSHSDSLSYSSTDGVGEKTGSRSSSGSSTYRQIVALDLRHGHAIYTERQRSSSGANTFVEGLGTPSTYTSSVTITERHILNLSGLAQTIWSSAPVTASSSGNAIFPVHPDSITCPGHSNDSSGGGGYDYGPTFVKTALYQSQIYGGIGYTVLATDHAGNSILSCEKIKPPSGGAEYYSAITGGDLVALSGMQGSNPRFSGCALIDYDGSYELP